MQTNRTNTVIKAGTHAMLAGLALALVPATMPTGMIEHGGMAMASAPLATLGVGDEAPPIKVEAFLKGDEVKSFKAGHVYVVEFWATWCGPCIKSMPHLSELQAEHKDDATFIGVNVWERYNDKTRDTVEKFVKKQGDKMAYTVAYDGESGTMAKSYMEAAKKNGIPCAFIVGGDGKIAWIGHPASMDGELQAAIKNAKKFAKDDAKKGDGTKDAKKESKPAASNKLSVGDAAPAISVETFVKGEPVTGFEKGKTYVVEFWATWCGPCIASMPHLSELQAEYKSKGVTFIGVNVWEDKVYSEKTLAKVREFVEKQGDKMAYTVAFDGAAKGMDEAYMKAGKRNGIPSAFLVDGSGKIAWIGHPMELDFVLPEVAGGTWDPVEGPRKIKAAQEAFMNAGQTLQSDAKAGAEAWAKAEKDYPVMGRMMESRKFMAFLMAEQYDEAYATGTKLVDKAIASKNAQELNQYAWTIVDPEATIGKRDVDLALRAAQKANEFTGDKDAAILDTLARCYFLKGDSVKAIETQRRAISNAEDGPMKKDLEKALEEYTKGVN
ncbi:MAG: redoxin family protein [Phycisphaerales bacterium]|nr:MAG: redoxin family protein [Phycisphaerales bacterium]